MKRHEKSRYLLDIHRVTLPGAIFNQKTSSYLNRISKSYNEIGRLVILFPED